MKKLIYTSQDIYTIVWVTGSLSDTSYENTQIYKTYIHSYKPEYAAAEWFRAEFGWTDRDIEEEFGDPINIEALRKYMNTLANSDEAKLLAVLKRGRIALTRWGWSDKETQDLIDDISAVHDFEYQDIE